MTFAAFVFSGCALFPADRSPSEIIADGLTYVKFQPERLYVAGIEGKDPATALFRENNHDWWRLENGTFDMYYAQHVEGLFWYPVLYCREDEEKIVKDYYENTDNFTYYIGRYYDENGNIPSVRKDDEEISAPLRNTEKPEEVVFAAADGKVVSTETKVFSNGNAVWNDSLVFTLYRTGADGLFCTLRARWMYYADTIYRWEDWTDDTDKLIVKTFSADVNEYMVSLLKEYRLAE